MKKSTEQNMRKLEGNFQKMVSWNLKVKFFGFSPNVKELAMLSEQEKFSNIESLKMLDIDNHIFILEVNDRGFNQTEFKAEIKK